MGFQLHTQAPPQVQVHCGSVGERIDSMACLWLEMDLMCVISWGGEVCVSKPATFCRDNSSFVLCTESSWVSLKMGLIDG